MRPGFVNGQKVFGMCSPIGEHPLMHKVKKVCTKEKPCLTGYSTSDPLPLTCETFLGGFGMEHGSATVGNDTITTWKHPDPDAPNPKLKIEGQEWVKAIAAGTQDALPKTSKNAVAYTCARVFVTHFYDPSEEVQTDCPGGGDCTYRFGTAYQIVQGMVVECHSTTETVYSSPKMTCTDSKITKSCYETTWETTQVKDDLKKQLFEEEKTIRKNLFAKGVVLDEPHKQGGDMCWKKKETDDTADCKIKKWEKCKSVNKMKLTSSA
jgi:hypothetical protein